MTQGTRASAAMVWNKILWNNSVWAPELLRGFAAAPIGLFMEAWHHSEMFNMEFIVLRDEIMIIPGDYRFPDWLEINWLFVCCSCLWKITVMLFACWKWIKAKIFVKKTNKMLAIYGKIKFVSAYYLPLTYNRTSVDISMNTNCIETGQALQGFKMWLFSLMLCSAFSIWICHVAFPSSLTHWGRDKMAVISKTTFSNAFSWMKMFEFRLKFLWSLFPRVQLTIFQQWFR